MRKLNSLIILFLCISFSVSAQYRVVKKSGSTPKWINGLELDYIIVSGSGETINLAQNDAINRVKENIIKSIADNVRSESKLTKEEKNNDEIFENFTNTISSVSGKIDFLNGLSVNKIDEFYWERIKNKKTKKYHFNYHIKYPFSSMELQALIDEYKFKDSQLTDELSKFTNNISNIKTIEEIKSNVEALRILKKSFIDKRQDIAELTIQKYINLVKNAEIKEIANEMGIFRFSILINGNKVSTSVTPKISSNCANITSNTKNNNIWTIKYDAKDCFEDETNFININFRFPFTTLKKKVLFNVCDAKFDININTPITFEKRENRYAAIIQLNSEHHTGFSVESLILEFKDMKPMHVNNINKRFIKNKVYSLLVFVKINEKMLEKIKEADTLNGYITYKSLLTEETKTYRIYKNKFYID
ncbi:MAG: hypothetical protein WBG43_08770 [Marinifilaceae bacterium]